MRYLRELTMPTGAQKIVLEAYIQAIDLCDSRVAQLKSNNSHARWMLIECAQHFRRSPKLGASLTTRQIGLTNEVKELSWRMQNRLHQRYVKLKLRGKNENKCIVAVTRELSAFIWEK